MGLCIRRLGRKVGVPPPVTIWRQEGQPMETNVRKTIAKNGTLLIRDCMSTDEGNYRTQSFLLFHLKYRYFISNLCTIPFASQLHMHRREYMGKGRDRLFNYRQGSARPADFNGCEHILGELKTRMGGQ